jgi:hypothetical protein
MNLGFPEDARKGSVGLLLVVVVLVGVVFVGQVAVFVKILVVFGFFFLDVFLFFEVIGDGVQCYGMSLRNLQLGFALRTTQDLSLFHFVFVHINFCGTFWAAEHGSILRN